MSSGTDNSSYRGGKAGSGVFQKIISLMPPHAVYIECFLGAGAILKNKRPAARSIGVESNPSIIKSHWTQPPAACEIVNADARDFLKVFKAITPASRDVLIYLDPPYLMSVRSSKKAIYAHEFATEAEHIDLLAILRQMPFNVLISGYDSPLYNETLHDWRKVSFAGISRGGPTTETVWMNFSEPAELHDYSFLGEGYRQRQDIRRQLANWRKRLAAMPAQRRYAMFSAIAEFKAAGDGDNADNRSINGPNAVAIAAASTTAELPSHPDATAETPSVDVEYCECGHLKFDHAGGDRNGPSAYHCFYCECGFYRPRHDHVSAFSPIPAREGKISSAADGETAATAA